jgi:hypothetical protein
MWSSGVFNSDVGLLVMHELDDALGLSDLVTKALRDNRRGKNTVHRLDELFRQSVFGRLTGYEDVNDADRPALDPVMRQVVTSLQLKMIKIGARVVHHARTITFQLAEVAVTGPMARAILAAIRRLRAPPLCA